MEELLQTLENRIRELIGKHDNLAQSNRQLDQGKLALAREREALMHKQQKAIKSIEGLIERLKSIGKMP